MPEFPPSDAHAQIRVMPVDARLAPAVRALQVRPDQAGFVGDVAFNLDDAQRDPLSDAMAILADDAVIGFYRLDRAPGAVVGRRLALPHLGVRAFMIDHRRQGRGDGARAAGACRDDARRRYPQHRWLALTVDHHNLAAIAAYRRAGFTDGDAPGQPACVGGQRLLLCKLDPFAAPVQRSTRPQDPTPRS